MATNEPKVNKEPNIRKVYTPTEEEHDRLQFVYKRYHQMGDKRRDEEANWEKWEKQWNAYRPPKDVDDWKSNIYIPITTAVIEAELSEVIEQSLIPWVVERGAEDSHKAKVMNSIIEYTWDIAKSNVALFEMIKSALIFGTGIGMEYYWRQPRTIRTEGGVDRQVFEYDDCYLEPVRLWDFFVDETARGFSGPYQARDCIRRYIMDIDDFRTFFKGDVWDKLGNAKYVKAGGDTNYYEFYKPPEKIEHESQVEVLWYWSKPLDLLCVVANDVVVVNKPNPYKHKQLPFVRTIDIHRLNQFYGKGEAELMESLQEETNTLRRMIIDRNHLDIDKPILVSDTLTIEDEDAIARPHGIIPVGDVTQARPLEYSDIPGSVFKSLEMLTDDRVRVTGMDERQTSVSTAGTATEAAILKEATLKRLNMKLWQIKQDTLIDIGRLRAENIMQFYSQPKLEEIVGEAEVEKCKADGTLVQAEDKNYKASYRNVRLEDQKMGVNPTTQQPEITQAKGYTFFQANPKFFLPTHGGYDLKYKATSQLPISKPLQQQKADEMYDRLVTNPSVDPWKLASYLIESREEEPDDFRGGQQTAPPQGPTQGQNLQKIIDLASMENSEMLKGKQISPTPYAPVVHTEVHIEFMKSENFKKQADEKVTQIFANHVTGEIAAQQSRGEAQPGAEGGQPPQGGGAPAPQQGQMPNGAASMQETVPSRMSGGGETANVSGAQSQ